VHGNHRIAQYGQNTGNNALVNHLKHHPRSWKQYEDILLGPEGELGKQFQSTLDGHVQKGAAKVPFSPERLTLAILKLIAACDLVCNLHYFMLTTDRFSAHFTR
jgi:hypothetical protein